MRKNSRCVGEGHLGKGKAMRAGLLGIGGIFNFGCDAIVSGMTYFRLLSNPLPIIIYRSI